MRNIWLVIKHEVVTRLRKPSYWLTTFVFPLLIMSLTFGSQFLVGRMVADEEQGMMEMLAGQLEDQPVSGYIDRGGLIQEFPEAFPRELVQAYPDKSSAERALQRGEIAQYYIVPTDYVETGDLTLVQKTFSPFQVLGDQNPLRYLLTYNLTGDQRTTQLLYNPAPKVSQTALAPEQADAQAPGGDTAGRSSTSVAYGVLFIFFFLITMSSGFMLNSVSQEKENRIVEILLLSLRPRDLMVGKILGLGAVGLLQMLIWVGGAMLLTGGLPIVAVAVLSNITLPPMFFVWGIFYFLLGYLTFASALGAIGALAPDTREGSQFTFVVLLPLMIPLWLNTTFTEAPNSVFAVILSLFPLSAPVAMTARLAATSVPLWQVLVSLGLLGLTSYGFILLAARLFRADTLLSTRELNWQRLFSNVRGAFTQT